MPSTSLFNLTINGSGNVGSEVWVDLGLIPTGSDYWIGKTSYTAIDKTTVFELRTNAVSKSTGTIANTSVLDSASVRTGSSTSHDLYRKGRLHTTTVMSTGVEHWWVRIYAKSATSGSYLYSISYTQE